MTDRITKEQRSKNMTAVKSRGNKSTEGKAASLLRRYKITGWRRHYKKIPGTPDFAFPTQKVAIFIDGCFWHGCKKCKTIPSTNKKFWTDKINKNVSRDRNINRLIKERGWLLVRIWEHELKESQVSSIEKISKILKDA